MRGKVNEKFVSTKEKRKTIYVKIDLLLIDSPW